MPAVAAATWRPNKDDQDDLEAIDNTITRLRNVTASDPYVLTIPQDVEPRYHHMHRTFAEQWLSNSPFKRDEHESLQYQTFVFHEHGKDMYVLQNSCPPVEETKVNGSSKVNPGTGANTPNAGPKKKISLGAYKKKQTGGASAHERDMSKGGEPPMKQAAVKGPVERMKAETEEILAVVAESQGELAPIDESQRRNAQKELKRKREEHAPILESKASKQLTSTTDSSLSRAQDFVAGPPAKKTKISSIERGNASNVDAPRTNQHTETARVSPRHGRTTSDMPPRLSPGMPPRLSPGMPEKLSPLGKAEDSTSRKQPATIKSEAKDVLPSRLSPTIPDNIARTLETRTNSHSTPQTFDSSVTQGPAAQVQEDKLIPSKRPVGITKRKSPAPRNGFRAGSSSPAVHSDAEENSRVSSANSRSKPPSSLQDKSVVVGKLQSSVQIQKQGEEALLVKIKYKRARREAVQRILKLPPKPTKTAPTQSVKTPPLEDTRPSVKLGDKRPSERKESGPAKGVAQKVGPVKRDKKPKSPEIEVAAPAEKRPVAEDEKFESPAKRKKFDITEPSKGPVTPAQQEADSPVASRSGQQATPGARKDARSGAMRREQSQDSFMTYNTPPELSSTPMVRDLSSQVNGTAKPPSSQPGIATPKQQAWETEQKRLEKLGRELKHAASAHLNASQQDPANRVMEQRLAAVKSVESFICYLVAFTCADEATGAAEPKQAPAYKIWRSLSGFFGFVKKATEPFAPLSGLACTLGMVFNSRILAIATQFPGDGPSRNDLLDTQAQMQRSAAEAENKLDVDVLQDSFPKSWRERAKKALPTVERLEPMKLGGQYKLPIIIATPPIRAARAGRALLHEWLEREKMSYTLKLKL